MYKAGRSFFYWVILLPVLLIVSVCVMEWILRVGDWFYAEPDSLAASGWYILYGREGFNNFIAIRLRGYILAVILGLGVWTWYRYSLGKRLSKKNLQ